MGRAWLGRSSILERINYWDELKDSPSQMETCFAIFAQGSQMINSLV